MAPKHLDGNWKKSNASFPTEHMRAGKPREWYKKLMKEEPKFEIKEALKSKTINRKIIRSKLRAMKRFVKDTTGFDHHPEEIRQHCSLTIEFLKQNITKLDVEESCQLLEAVGAARWQSKGSCDFLDVMSIVSGLPVRKRSQFFINSVLQGNNTQNSEVFGKFQEIAHEQKCEILIDEKTMTAVGEIGANKNKISPSNILELIREVPIKQKMEIMEVLSLEKRWAGQFGKEAIRLGSKKAEILKKVIQSIGYKTCFEESVIKRFFEKKRVIRGLFLLSGLMGSAYFALCFSVEGVGFGIWGFVALDIVAGIVGVFVIPIALAGLSETKLGEAIGGFAKTVKIIVDRLWWISWFGYNHLKPKNNDA